jgi:hypothetical protein
MAEQADRLLAQEAVFDDAVLRDSTMQARSIGQKLTMHWTMACEAGRMTHKANFWYRLVSRDWPQQPVAVRAALRIQPRRAARFTFQGVMKSSSRVP